MQQTTIENVDSKKHSSEQESATCAQLDLNYFCTAHRSDKKYSEVCKNLHGHNYGVKIKLGKHDATIDISVLKKCLNDWVQNNLDHAVIVAARDKPLLAFLVRDEQKYYIFPNNLTISPASIAKLLFMRFDDVLQHEPIEHHAKLHSVQVVCEAEGASATSQAT